jgi:hypothetical protein
MHLINTCANTSASSPQTILDHIRDLQGYCSIQGNNFSENDEMYTVFGDIEKNLAQIRSALEELHHSD